MLKPTEPIIDLGQVKFGQEYKFKFELTNTYDKPANILKLMAGCSSCTKAVASQSVVSPKEKMFIDVVFKPGAMGLTSKFVDVVHSVNGELKPAEKLRFKAVVS